MLQTSLSLIDGFVSLALVRINQWLHWEICHRDPSLLPVRFAQELSICSEEGAKPFWILFPGITLKCIYAFLYIWTYVFSLYIHIHISSVCNCFPVLDPARCHLLLLCLRLPQFIAVLHGFVGFLFQMLLICGSPRRRPSSYIHWEEL